MKATMSQHEFNGMGGHSKALYIYQLAQLYEPSVISKKYDLRLYEVNAMTNNGAEIWEQNYG